MLQNQHDKLFKWTFSQPQHAAELVRTSLPAALLEHLELDSLTLSPGSFVDENMRERFTDLLYRVNLAGREAFVYLLLEHKSVADALTAFFMARYTINILGDHVNKNPRARVLPAVIPLVVHHGAGGFRAATRLMQLYNLPPAEEAPGLREALAGHLLDIDLMVDDLSRHSDDELRGRAMSAVSKLALMLLARVMDGEAMSVERLEAEFVRCADLFIQVATSETGVAAMAMFMRYIMGAAEVSREDLGAVLERTLGPAIQEAYMNTAERIHKEGYDQGYDQGRQSMVRMLLMLLEERFGPLPAAIEQRVRAAGLDELEAWSRAVLRAPSLDDIFAA